MVELSILAAIIAYYCDFYVLKNLPRHATATGVGVTFAKWVEKFMALRARFNAGVIKSFSFDCHDVFLTRLPADVGGLQYR